MVQRNTELHISQDAVVSDNKRISSSAQMSSDEAKKQKNNRVKVWDGAALWIKAGGGGG